MGGFLQRAHPFFIFTTHILNNTNMEFRTKEFISPSGRSFTIREQNGEDENIISNPVDAKNLMNLTKFISAIVVNTNVTANGKLTVKDALDLPLLDRYCILLQSRIFSLGDTLDIPYVWPGDKTPVTYSEEVSNYLFSDYSSIPSDEELDSKPYALPYYPDFNKLTDRQVTLSTGKIISYDLLNGHGEQYIMSLPEAKQTRNSELLARNLKVEVNGVMEKVHNFSNFTAREMAEIRSIVKTYDPVFQGLTELENPSTGEIVMYPIMASSTFFFLTEA